MQRKRWKFNHYVSSILSYVFRLLFFWMCGHLWLVGQPLLSFLLLNRSFYNMFACYCQINCPKYHWKFYALTWTFAVHHLLKPIISMEPMKTHLFSNETELFNASNFKPEVNRMSNVYFVWITYSTPDTRHTTQSSIKLYILPIYTIFEPKDFWYEFDSVVLSSISCDLVYDLIFTYFEIHWTMNFHVYIRYHRIQYETIHEFGIFPESFSIRSKLNTKNNNTIGNTLLLSYFTLYMYIYIEF